MTRTPRLFPLLLVLFSFELSGCLEQAAFQFQWPLGGAVVPADSSFSLTIPGPNVVELSLDGDPIDAAAWTRSAGSGSGALDGLAPGTHTLRATYPFVGPLVYMTSTTFEVAGAAPYDVRGSLEQLFVTHANPGQMLTLQDAQGASVQQLPADYQGSLIFRNVAPGAGYTVATTAPFAISPPVEIEPVVGSVPPQAFYEDQELGQGFGYITMRDGTQLSVFVSLPGPIEDGPYPTVVNYSGYEPSQPDGGLLGGLDLSFLCGALPVLCDPPNHPSGLIAGALNFASVGVNMRGTGCSGGAYDFFEPLQVTDAYDLIEIIASQDWVMHNHVGMAGISYPGISQLFAAQSQPPSLAAITPLSVISGVDTTLGPGGIINSGFAVEWGTRVLNRADPYGQGWEQAQVDLGDTVCEENQLLHSQKVDIIQKALDNQFYTPEIYDPLNPRAFVGQIEVPVFTVGQWQDEQTGGHFPDLWNRYTNAPLLRFTGLNGAHADGFTPEILSEWYFFLDFYVTKQVRPIPPALVTLGPLLFDQIFGEAIPLPEHRFLDFPTFEAALAAYEAEPPGRIIFEAGGDPAAPGVPGGRFEIALESWPPPSAVAERWYLQEDGSLSPLAPAAADESATTFEHDNDQGDETYLVNGSFEGVLPNIQWLPWQPGRQGVWVSEPVLEDRVMLGHGSADLWIQSTAEDADLEVTLSEVRPDGQESYISNGWLRASRRALDLAESSELKPKQTHVESDAAPLPLGQWEPVRVEIYPFAHVLRAGSRLRISVSTPGGNKGRWEFDVLQFEEPVTHAIAHSAAFPSSVVLSVLPDVVAPAGHSACPGLRAQYCRDYVPHTNALLEGE